MKRELDFLYKRRSIRQYTGKVIDDPTVRELLEAGMAAPSAVAKDPWRFIVSRKPDVVSAITEGLPYGKMLPSAGCAITVCGDMDAANGGELSYMLQDCSAAIQNILLAAEALGLGAVWLGVHPNQERIDHLRGALNIPDTIIPVSVVSVGYPAETKESRTRYVESSVHFERW